MDYFNTNRSFKAEKGDLLISEPFLPDPNFERTVILLCEHDEDGSFGFVLNKPTVVEVEEVMDNGLGCKEKLFVGGPVQQNSLHFIHRSKETMGSGVEIINGIHWGGDFDTLFSLINTNKLDKNDFKFFLGYSGWSEGQLDEELAAKSWIVYKAAQQDHVFDFGPEELWRNVLKELGGRYKMFSNYPEDPRLN